MLLLEKKNEKPGKYEKTRRKISILLKSSHTWQMNQVLAFTHEN
jgi:hypothetical protein